MKKILTVLIPALAAIFISVFVLTTYINNQQATDPSIASYEECVQAGFPSMETYPEQCRTDDGKHFVRNLPADQASAMSSPIKIQGELVCLPHWDMSGPVTMECAFGLLARSGSYYVISADPGSEDLAHSEPTGSMVEISGIFTPGSSSKYRSIGTIKIDTISQLAKIRLFPPEQLTPKSE